MTRTLLRTLVVVAVTTASTFAVAPAALADAFTVPADVPADCSRPVDAELNQWLASVPDGSTVLFPAGACYGQDDTLLVQDRHDLTFEGNGSTFRALTDGHVRRSSWRIQGGSNITLRNMTVVGDNPEPKYVRGWEFQHGIDVRSAAGVTAEGVNVSNVYGECLYVGSDMRLDRAAAPPATDIRFSGGKCEVTGRMAVGVINGDGVTVENSHFGGIALSAIDIEPDLDSETARNVVVRGNTFGAVWHHILTDGGKGGGPTRGNVTFEGNRMLEDASSCVEPIRVAPPSDLRRAGYVVRDNLLKTHSYAFRAYRVSDVVYEGNVAEWRRKGCSASAGVYLASVRGERVSDSDFYGFARMISASVSTYKNTGNNLYKLA